MNIDVINYIEREDGGANLELDLDEEAVQLILSVGVNKILSDHLDSIKEKFKQEDE